MLQLSSSSTKHKQRYYMSARTQSNPRSSHFKRIFLILFLASLAFSALVAISIFLFGKFDWLEGQMLLTALAVGGYSLAGLCCSLLLSRGNNHKPLVAAGIAVSIVGFVFALISIWVHPDSVIVWKATLLGIVLSFSIAHASLLLLAYPTKNDVILRSSLIATSTFIVIVAGMITALILIDNSMFGEFYYRLIGVFAVLDVLGTIATPILRKIRS